MCRLIISAQMPESGLSFRVKKDEWEKELKRESLDTPAHRFIALTAIPCSLKRLSVIVSKVKPKLNDIWFIKKNGSYYISFIKKKKKYKGLK